MNINNFLLYFVLPFFTLILIFTNRYYYSKRQSEKMRFHMSENLLLSNIIVPILGLIVVIAIYAGILNIQFVSQLRWELLGIFTIAVLSLIVGLALGGHICALSVERSMKLGLPTPETSRVLYFFHWPFGHIASYIPATLIFYVLVLLDLFKGTSEPLVLHQQIILILCAGALGIASTIMLILTKSTRIMFYTLLVLSLSIVFVLRNENITLDEHLIAYFFSLLFFTTFVLLGMYRYIHFLSLPLHRAIQSKFPDGDRVRDED